MEKVSLSISLSVGLLRNEAFTPFIAELRRFQVAGPDRKSVRPVSDMNLHPSMTGDSTERPGENRRIDWFVETIQRNRWAEGPEGFSYLPSIPPSLQTTTCFKEQNFIKLCHSVFVSRCGGGVVAGMRAGALKDQSFATEELLTRPRHQCWSPAYESSRLSQCVPTTRTPGAVPGNEGAHTQTHSDVYIQSRAHTHISASMLVDRKYCKRKKYTHICLKVGREELKHWNTEKCRWQQQSLSKRYAFGVIWNKGN